MALAGKALGKDVGTRFGPSAAAGAVRWVSLFHRVFLRAVGGGGNGQTAGGEGVGEGSVGKGVSVGLWRTKSVEGEKKVVNGEICEGMEGEDDAEQEGRHREVSGAKQAGEGNGTVQERMREDKKDRKRK
ncbi:hypothetical protein C8J57DRAFT_1258420 [Mycena rebaudengoi]|nr:hypothetical protein C8J57DRAFT_1258420 [Mycena rebaudengoi]